MALKKGGLGKGLDLIFMENDTEDRNNTVTLKISEIEPNRTQPRKDFNEEALAELADSIAQHGVLQPLLVRPIATGGYQIVAGERRWRAARMAGVSEVPVVVRELTDGEVMEIALIENLQREDLSAVEEALGYQTLMDTYNLTQEEVSKTVGKSRPTITNALRLLNLPSNILDMVSEGVLSSGHARTLLAFKSFDDMQEAAKLVIEEGMSVRGLERLVKKCNERLEEKKNQKTPKKRNAFFDEVELALNEHLGRKVRVQCNSKQKGILQIEFYNKDDLQQLVKYFD